MTEVIASAAAPALPEGGHAPLSVDRSGRLRTNLEAMPALTPKVCPVSATTALTGVAAGAIGDYLDSLLIEPTSTSPGVVQIKDGSGTAIDIFVGGASSIATLHPFSIPLGVTSQAGAWSVICGANVKAVAIGRFA